MKSYLDCLDLRFDYYFSKLTQIRLSNWLFDDISSIWRRLRKCFPAYAFSVICFYDLEYKHEGCWWRKNDLLVIYVHFMDFDHWFCVGCSSEPTLTTIPQFFCRRHLRPKYLYAKRIFCLSLSSSDILRHQIWWFWSISILKVDFLDQNRVLSKTTFTIIISF